MGFFAVLCAEDCEGAQIAQCHVNLWSLPSGLPGRRFYYFDVGLEVEAGASPVHSIQLLLPFRAEEVLSDGKRRWVQDLTSHISTQPTADLVFGEPVEVHGSGDEFTIYIDGRALELVNVDVPNVGRADGYEPRQDSTLFAVPLTRAIKAGERRYIRLRWHLRHGGEVFHRRRLRSGLIVDFRMADVRESRFSDTERVLRDRIMPVQMANVFLVLPAAHQFAEYSPTVKYVRLLEPGAWRDYLKGAAYRRTRERLVVYHFSGERIHPDSPFRVYADFRGSVPLAPWLRWLWLLASFLVAIVIFRAAETLSWADAKAFVKGLKSSKTLIIAALGLGSVAGAFKFFKVLRTFSKNWFFAPRSWMRQQEKRLLTRLRA